MAIDTTKMTRKGQVTTPAAIRNALDLHEGDHFIVHQDDHRVILERASDIVDRTAGVFARYAREAAVSPSDERAWFERLLRAKLPRPLRLKPPTMTASHEAQRRSRHQRAPSSSPPGHS